MSEDRDRQVLENEIVNKRLHSILRHIDGVRENCNEMARRLVAIGETDFARKLIANSSGHDKSKLEGIEWEYLHDEKHPHFAVALHHHITTNLHHPEAWGSIHEMPRIFVAEMVADWKTRCNEFGTDLKNWIAEKATERWKFEPRSKIAKEIKCFVELILDPKFT